jgi:hypothetical protein
MPPASWWPAWLPSSRLSLLLLPWSLGLQHMQATQSSSSSEGSQVSVSSSLRHRRSSAEQLPVVVSHHMHARLC